MKQLSIHIGYPKTATTTFQEELFVKLHNLKQINYLGRTTRSSHTRLGKSNFNGIDWVWHIRKHLLNGEDLKYDNTIIKENILNVISDEDLCFHDFFHFAQFGKLINHNDFANQLKDIIGSDVKVNIIVTLRNQSDLIFSSFVQKYRFIKQYIGNYTFSNFLENQYDYLKRKPIDHLAIYDFNKHIESWETVFNTKAKVLFFEDFIHDKNSFYNQLAELLPATALEIEDYFGSIHYRKRDKSKELIDISFKELSNFGKIMSHLYKKNKFERILEQRFYMRSNVLLNMEKRVWYKQKKTYLPSMTKGEKEKIELMFNNSNKLFAQKREISLEKMLVYKFVRK